MKTPSARFVPIALAAVLLLSWPARALAAETADAVEKDLAAVFQRMDAMKVELDRIEELAAAPKATMLRIEILSDESAPVAPVRARFLVEGRVEDERESFSDRHVPMPLVFVIPYLPGNWPARLEVQNSAWKTAPVFDFQAAMRKGETTVLRLRIGAAAGKAEPVLTRAPEPVAPKPAPAPAKAGGK
jgi:hypothetical protein